MRPATGVREPGRRPTLRAVGRALTAAALLVLPGLAAGNAGAQEIDDAVLLASHLPTALQCGESFNAWLTLCNVGTTTWTADGGYALGAVDNEDPLGPGRVNLPGGIGVSPGECHTFQFTLTAPQKPGDYYTDWQMVREFVTWFGPIAASNVQVSCEQPSDGAELVAAHLPTALACGQSFAAWLTFRNSGTTTWTPEEGYALGAGEHEDPLGVPGRVYLAREVHPGDSYTVQFTLTGPLDPGGYYTDWQMVREFVHWFGPVAARSVKVACATPTDDAELVDYHLPTALGCGESDVAWVTLRNSGTTTWVADEGYALGAVDNSDPLGGPLRIPDDGVAPGQ